MMKELAIELALVVALAVCGVRLSAELEFVRRRARVELALAGDNQLLVLRSASGIDVSGKFISAALPTRVERLAVFGLRRSSLGDDLRVWGAVQAQLGKAGTVHFVGFCDGTDCAESVRRLRRGLVPFPVLAYGEATAVQAVVNADAYGRMLLLDRKMRLLRQIEWRTPGYDARAISDEVLR